MNLSTSFFFLNISNNLKSSCLMGLGALWKGSIIEWLVKRHVASVK